MGVIILAGGTSRRMGADKARLKLHGRRLLDIVFEAALEYDQNVVIVGGIADGPEILPDLYPGQGPLGGLITGLKHLGSGIHIALACDMPFISARVLRGLESAVGSGDAVVPEFGGKLHPLCAAYRGESVEKLIAAFESGERSLYGALRHLDVERIPESLLRELDSTLCFLTNVNTPEDWERLKHG